MTILDISALLILLASLFLGINRGFIKEIFSLLAYVFAITGSILYESAVFDFLTNYIESSTVRMILSYLVIFIFIFFSIALVGSFTKSLIRTMKLSSADHGLGGIFGLIRGVLLITIFVVIFEKTYISNEIWWKDSISPKLARKTKEKSKYFLENSLNLNQDSFSKFF